MGGTVVGDGKRAPDAAEEVPGHRSQRRGRCGGGAGEAARRSAALGRPRTPEDSERKGIPTIARKERELLPVPFPVTGEVEARPIALACSQPLAGHARWSLRLLEKHVALTEDIPDLDHSTIGRVLKRNFVLI